MTRSPAQFPMLCSSSPQSRISLTYVPVTAVFLSVKVKFLHLVEITLIHLVINQQEDLLGINRTEAAWR